MPSSAVAVKTPKSRRTAIKPAHTAIGAVGSRWGVDIGDMAVEGGLSEFAEFGLARYGCRLPNAVAKVLSAA